MLCDRIEVNSNLNPIYIDYDYNNTFLFKLKIINSDKNRPFRLFSKI